MTGGVARESARRRIAASAICIAFASHPLARPHAPAGASAVPVAAGTPTIEYTVRVDPADTTGFDVTMRIRNAPDTVQLAMAAHPEYDDRYWRYVTDVRTDSPHGVATITRVDSAVWQVSAPGGDVTIHYRLALPAAQPSRYAYRPFVSPTGAMVGDLHTFMYVVGAPGAPAHVTLDIPADWKIATALEPTVDAHTFVATDAEALVDAPILLGDLREWRFEAGGTPHLIAYWPAPGALPFDTAALVDGIHRIAARAIALFGRAPYRRYNFLLRDGAFGALEHANSVTIGIPSRDLAHNTAAYFEEIAHEYFHAWNMMRIRPAEFAGVSYRSPRRSSSLWWSEGATMFYADLLLRRAGLPVDDSSRTAHLARLLGDYYSTSGNALLSPERVSRAAYGLQGAQLGDNTASTHLQGEVLITELDLLVRRATGGRRSIDDVMRAMMEWHAGPTGFTTDDVAAEVARMCGCAAARFFAEHVHGAAPLDMNHYLAMIGMRSGVSWVPAVNADGVLRPDLRVFAWQAAGDSGLRLMVLDTASVWERAGLHTGDRVMSINGDPVASLTAFRAAIASLRIGDSIRVTVRRRGREIGTVVKVAGFRRAVATIEDLPNASPADRTLRRAWLAGTPGP